jgi:hypothetical protein
MSSQLMAMLICALSEGKLCVIDVSQMRRGHSLVLSGLILRRIFDRNQQEFTSAAPKTIPTIAVVEEAQAVLNESAVSEPYVTWVKEGRKYDLGALLITQQPGSIPVEILSQGDNWFIFHMLSAADLTTLKRANAHFSDDLLSSLLNEPIPGQGVFWSSVQGKPYPVSVRALSFEGMYSMRDPGYSQPAAWTHASKLRDVFSSKERMANAGHTPVVGGAGVSVVEKDAGPVDTLEVIKQQAVEALKANRGLMSKIVSPKGAAWGEIRAFFLEHLPGHLDDVNGLAYQLVKTAMDRLYGPQGQGWETYRNETKKTYVRKKG